MTSNDRPRWQSATQPPADAGRGSGSARTVAAGGGQVRIRKSSSRRLRDLPDLDLRTPSGRVLPY